MVLNGRIFGLNMALSGFSGGDLGREIWLSEAGGCKLGVWYSSVFGNCFWFLLMVVIINGQLDGFWRVC